MHDDRNCGRAFVLLKLFDKLDAFDVLVVDVDDRPFDLVARSRAPRAARRVGTGIPLIPKARSTWHRDSRTESELSTTRKTTGTSLSMNDAGTAPPPILHGKQGPVNCVCVLLCVLRGAPPASRRV